MNLFTRNSSYSYLLKYLLFLLKHPVYTQLYESNHTNILTGRHLLGLQSEGVK